jgi:AcrR family transcriptional regulator
MLEAGRDVFGQVGYTAATMQEIARRARVAPQTLYFSFNSKPRLLRAVMDFVSTGGLEYKAVPDRDWYREAANTNSLQRVLELLVDGGAGIAERLGPISQAIAEAAALEPEIAQRRQELTAGRLRGVRHLVHHINEFGGLHPRLLEAEATDVIYVLSAPETYRRFNERGWTVDRWKRWLLDELSAMIVKPLASGRRRQG